MCIVQSAMRGLLVLGIVSGFVACDQAENGDIKQQLQFCRYDYRDYSRIKSAFEATFPIGSSASKLIGAIEKSPGSMRGFHHYPVKDYSVKSTTKLYAYWYGYNCEEENKNNNIWTILFIINEKNILESIEFSLFFEDDNFSEREIIFDFENFASEDAGRRALWSITGNGTSRQHVQEIMEAAGLKKFQTYKQNSQVIDQYRKFPDKSSIAARIGNYNVWVLNWRFDMENHLEHLDIQ